MSVDNDLVSVLVPAYNVEETFEQFMDSLLNQTYDNLEIIIIDDGSSDNTANMCDNYAAIDSRISVIHKFNGGLSTVRNMGITMASGPYVIFVDSDDTMMPTQIETLHRIMRDKDSDIAICDWFDNEITEQDIAPSVRVMEPSEFMPLVLTDQITSHLWNKMFRRNLWDGIDFPVGRVAQDMAVIHKVFHKASSVAQTNEKLYVYYSENPNNTSNRNAKTLRSSIDRAYAFESRYEMAKQEYPEVEAAVFSQLASFSVASYYKAIINHSDASSDLLAWLKSNRHRILLSQVDFPRKALALIAGSPLEGVASVLVKRRL